jgi:hypothetical protein
MSQLDRKDFIKLTITVVTTACLAPACSEEDPATTPTGGSGGGPTGGAAPGGAGAGGTAGSATGGMSGTPTGGTAGSASGSGGSASGAGGAGAGGTGAGGAGAGGTGAGGAGAGGAGAGGGGRGGAGAGGAGAGGGGRGGAGAGGAAAGAGGGGGMMCMQNNFGIMQTSAEMHDHLPLMGGMSTTANFVMQVNAGVDFTFTLPMDNGHTHSIMITAAECTTLRGGGMVTGKMASSGGTPAHTHTYTIECGA